MADGASANRDCYPLRSLSSFSERSINRHQVRTATRSLGFTAALREGSLPEGRRHRLVAPVRPLGRTRAWPEGTRHKFRLSTFESFCTTSRKKTMARLTKKDFEILPKRYWTRPTDDPAKVGDQSFENVHSAVGQALSSWEGVEERIASLFMRLSNDFDFNGSLAKTFGSIENSSARFKVTTAAAERCFGNYWLRNEVKWTFDSLSDNFSAASHRRNEIAHGIATAFRSVSLDPHSPSTKPRPV